MLKRKHLPPSCAELVDKRWIWVKGEAVQLLTLPLFSVHSRALKRYDNFLKTLVDQQSELTQDPVREGGFRRRKCRLGSLPLLTSVSRL